MVDRAELMFGWIFCLLQACTGYHLIRVFDSHNGMCPSMGSYKCICSFLSFVKNSKDVQGSAGWAPETHWSCSGINWTG